MRAKNPMRQSWLAEGKTEGWIALRLELLTSPAWRLRPIPLCRILERLEIEHMRHAGKENGGLVVSYDQFVAHGVSRRVIRPALLAGQNLGLMKIVVAEQALMKRPRKNARHADHMEMPNAYRLTYFPEKGRRAPTDEWSSVTLEQAQEHVAAFTAATAKKQKCQFPFRQPTSSLSGTKTRSTSSLSGKSPVPEMEPPITSATIADKARSAKQASHQKASAQRSGPARVVVHEKKDAILPTDALAKTPIGQRLELRVAS